MLVYTLADGSKFYVKESATIMTNMGPKQADEAQVGHYIRLGGCPFCRIDMIVQK